MYGMQKQDRGINQTVKDRIGKMCWQMKVMAGYDMAIKTNMGIQPEFRLGRT